MFFYLFLFVCFSLTRLISVFERSQLRKATKIDDKLAAGGLTQRQREACEIHYHELFCGLSCEESGCSLFHYRSDFNFPRSQITPYVFLLALLLPIIIRNPFALLISLQGSIWHLYSIIAWITHVTAYSNMFECLRWDICSLNSSFTSKA